jgi:hypothetical protein
MNNMMLDIAFEVVTEKSFEDLTREEIMTGILKRMVSLMDVWDVESIGFCEQHEIELIEPKVLPIPTPKHSEADIEMMRWAGGDHPLYTRKRWREEVIRRIIDIGYWDWVCLMITEKKL